MWFAKASTVFVSPWIPNSESCPVKGFPKNKLSNLVEQASQCDACYYLRLQLGITKALVPLNAIPAL